MKVAIPEHQGRVAPVFDCCRKILIFVQTSEWCEPVGKEDWSALPRSFRAGRLKDLVVELVICGGISCWMENSVRQNGIRLIPWVAGDVAQVMEAFRNNLLSDPCFLMPGRIGCRRQRDKGLGCSRTHGKGE